MSSNPVTHGLCRLVRRSKSFHGLYCGAFERSIYPKTSGQAGLGFQGPVIAVILWNSFCIYAMHLIVHMVLLKNTL
jgi:hypothetical protein